jgi:A/G-specific adenine glycosylase
LKLATPSPASFAHKVVELGSTVSRQLPWISTADPYKIWISEIILQQTRVETGTGYYLRFIDRFPDVKSLATSPIDDVLKLWEGLGYYARARNLHAAAQQVVTRHEGIFPNIHSDILDLKGIGPYTAAAISSFAFGQRYASIDGNALRLIARTNGYVDAVGSATLQKRTQEFANEAIAHADPAAFNQAMMDIGSQICKPQDPVCERCSLSEICYAFTYSQTHLLPTKKQKITVKARYFHFLLAADQRGKILIEQRQSKDIWHQLFQLPLIETSDDVLSIRKEQISDLLGQKTTSFDFALVDTRTQLLTHQKIYASFYSITGLDQLKIKQDQYLVEPQKVLTFAYPKVIRDFLINLIP